jgi:hypothetical protein
MRKSGRVEVDTILNWGLESPQNPQAGKPALRSADIPVGGFGRLSSRPGLPGQTSRPRTVRSCTQSGRLLLPAAKLFYPHD